MKDHGVPMNPLGGLISETHGLSAEQVVEERVDALRRDLEDLGLVRPGPPYDPYAYAEALGIPVIEIDEPGVSFDAVLMPQDRNGFRIGVKSAGVSPGRRRFSVAHELVHTLLPDARERAHYRLQAGAGADKALERLVDHGAAHLLMPPTRFGADLRELGFDPVSLRELAGFYGVSLEAAAVCAVRTARAPCAVAFCEFAYRPTTRQHVTIATEQKQWRVGWACHAHGFPVYLYRGYRFDRGSAVERAAYCRVQVTGRLLEKGSDGRLHALHATSMRLSEKTAEPPSLLCTFEHRTIDSRS